VYDALVGVAAVEHGAVLLTRDRRALQIRDVPDEVRRQLKARAAAAGKSLNRYLLDVMEREVARPTMQEVLHRAARRTERSTASALGALDAARQEREEQWGDRSAS
jgi:plasmid stability protein